MFALLQFSSLEASATITLTDYHDINPNILCPIAAAMFNILIAVASIMVLYAAYLYVTGRGDPEKMAKAHKTITYAAVGVVVALLAKTFPTIVASIVGGSTEGGC